jgi:hypothetical protein
VAGCLARRRYVMDSSCFHRSYPVWWSAGMTDIEPQQWRDLADLRPEHVQLLEYPEAEWLRAGMPSAQLRANLLRAWSVSVVSTTLCSGARNADGPMSSRACAVCSGVVRYGCAPALRRAESCSTRGPRAATTRRLAGTPRSSG